MNLNFISKLEIDFFGRKYILFACNHGIMVTAIKNFRVVKSVVKYLVILFLCLIKHYTMKANVGLNVN